MCIDCGNRAVVFVTIGVCNRCYQARQKLGNTRIPAPKYGVCRCGCGEPLYEPNRHWSRGHKKAITQCRCGCGLPVPDRCSFVQGHQNHLWRGKERHKQSEETRRRLSAIRAAEWAVPELREHFLQARRERWLRSGRERTELLLSLRRHDGYRAWHQQVLERDDFTCRKCGDRGGTGHQVRLEVHHIKAFAERLDLALCVANGITLCTACHRKTKSYARKTRKGAVQLPFSFVFDAPF